MNPSPIGVFDSGLGGLSVAARILKRLPNESILYLADTAHVPYGERPLEEIQGFALDITRYLRDQGAKMVVMACNMSSAVALKAAREAIPEIPILGVIEPGARAAAHSANGRPVGVLATTGTVKSGAYCSAIHSIAPSTLVFQQACPSFVPLVESGRSAHPEAFEAAREYVEPLKREGVGTIVLGCTHYPFLAEAIIASAGPSVRLVDPAEETAAEVEKTLLESSIQAPAGKTIHRFLVTGEPKGFAELGSRLIEEKISDVERAVWEEDLGRVLV